MRFWQDDNGNESSFRIWWMPFIAVVILAFGVVLGLFIREILAQGENVRELFNAMGLTGGTGVFAFLAKAFQKRHEKPIEKPTEAPEVVKHPEVVKQPQALKIVIDRFKENHLQTLGHGGIWNGSKYVFKFVTLELAWKDNKRNISRIPSGEFESVAVPRTSNGEYAILLMNVIDRSEIMIHAGNFHTDIRGCILVGKEFKDLNADGQEDVTESKLTMLELKKRFPIGTRLKVEIR
jgi:hypothetical protein